MTTSPAIPVIRAEDGAPSRAARAALAVLAGVALLTLSAKIQIPFHPVPMTMQSAMVLLLGGLLGPRLGAGTVAAYVVLGAAGAPVFAAAPYGGLPYLMGPTGGYLIGFIAAAALMGLATTRGFVRGPLTAFAAGLAGMATLFAFGLLQLGALIGWGPAVWTAGAAPFLLGSVVKAALAAAVLSLKAARP